MRPAIPLIAVLLLAGPPGPLAGHPLDVPSTSWSEGPVRYLLTPREARAFRGLPADPQRSRFVEAFWRRRDPTPRTARNEFRQTFWDRVDRCESLRPDIPASGPMWRTLPGKWFILLGPPQAERTEGERLQWIYSNPEVSLVFAPARPEGIRVESAPDVDARRLRGLDAPLPCLSPAREPDPFVRWIRATEPLPQLAGTRPLPRPGAGSLPLAVRADFYRAVDGTTYVAFTLEGPSAPTELLPYGGLVGLDGRGTSFPLSGVERFTAAGADAPGVLQTGLGLDPGRYRAFFALRDPATGAVGSWRGDLTVPDLRGDGPALSSLTLARVLEPAAGPAAPDVKVPFRLGGLRVVPRVRPVLAGTEEFQLYYQVYGAPGAEPRPVEISYRLEGLHGGRWLPLGDPVRAAGRTGSVQAWSFPVRGWPPGLYRLTVAVRDPAKGQAADEALSFEVRS
ncbi:MAG: GWxTD domain-containing protein [Acidobacteriota bacterium]|jgi:GWxTD domain-containing protein